MSGRAFCPRIAIDTITLEELVIGLFHDKSMAVIVSEVFDRTWLENIAPVLIMLFILIPPDQCLGDLQAARAGPVQSAVVHAFCVNALTMYTRVGWHRGGALALLTLARITTAAAALPALPTVARAVRGYGRPSSARC
jgi:hypothetical protein